MLQLQTDSLDYEQDRPGYAGPAKAAIQARFLDPDLVRWEKHRCWVVEATLHPGERNVDARRHFYIDEDTWGLGLVDMYDGNNTLHKTTMVYVQCRPELPGVIYMNQALHNLQSGDYNLTSGNRNQKARPSLKFFQTMSTSPFDPTNMAASAQY